MAVVHPVQAAGGARWIDGEIVETWPVDPHNADWVEYEEDDDDE